MTPPALNRSRALGWGQAAAASLLLCAGCSVEQRRTPRADPPGETTAEKTLPAAGAVAVGTESFQKVVLEAEGLAVLDFWAEWCAPCLELNPILDRVAKEFHGRATFCKIDVDANPDLAAEYAPDNMFPCLILMRDGEVLDRRYGADPTMEIDAFLRSWVESGLNR